MASAGNWFETRRKAHDLRTKTITTSSTVTSYTTRAGGTSGQRLLITWITKGGSETVTLTMTGEGATFTGEDAYVSLEWIDSTNGWRVLDSDTD